MDNFFERPERRELNELNLVPVIDMFTTVIFFLLLSTVFVALNKLTIPPSQVSTITDPIAPPPLAAVLLVGEGKQQESVKLQLSWAGKDPGHFSDSVTIPQSEVKTDALADTTRKLAESFHSKFPQERTIRVGLERGLSYQRLISVMDGLSPSLPDTVLISYEEAEAHLGASQ